MSSLVLLCTDGSELATAALAAGLALLGPDVRAELVAVIDDPDPMMVTGTGFASGVMSPEEFDREAAAAHQGGIEIITEAQEFLGLAGTESHLIRGEPGPAICTLAGQLGAAAIVIGSRGRGGLRRAVLGSVSDHVVRHAPCTVVVTGPAGTETD